MKEHREHLNTMRAMTIIAKVKKMSNYGYSEHERILKVNNLGISYFSKIPKELQHKTTFTREDISSMKPKQSIAIANIWTCDRASSEELKVNKKFYKMDQQVIKIVFDKRGLVKGPLGETDESDDDEESLKPPSQSTLKNLRGDKSWLINLGT